MRSTRSFQSVCVLAVLLTSWAATTAHASMFLAPTTSFVPITDLNSLQSACEAVQANSVVYAMYTPAVLTEVDEYMAKQSTTQAFVAAYFVVMVGWYWRVTQMGETWSMAVNATEFVGGTLPNGSTGKYAVYNTTGGGLQAVDGRTDYKVLCYVETLYSGDKSSKFPWWAIVIIVVGAVVIVVVVVIAVYCCRKKKKPQYADEDDTISFSSRGTSGTDSSLTDSRSFSTNGSSNYMASSKNTSRESSDVSGSQSSSDSDKSSSCSDNNTGSRETEESSSTYSNRHRDVYST
ncbi:hypothetical protein ABL78_8077 [Leptomonas seymouri]|uniref:Membrane-associated protein n=1 Tax=Leptomonas seymouri TaxID=5684 RepID=A0A0N1PBW5_LEPSE|nr:hypothetical protein ABL78_8077 [Leptomonas seymouri]|eukprot:KPI82908.1 hypothetical protein ABL78_8077 [Leptomonas seymouri]